MHPQTAKYVLIALLSDDEMKEEGHEQWTNVDDRFDRTGRPAASDYFRDDIIFGLFVAFTAAQVWTDNEKARTEIDREASALRSVVILATSFPRESELSPAA